MDERREALASLSFANGPVTWDNGIISVTCRVRKYAQADQLGVVSRRDFHLVGPDGTLHDATGGDESDLEVPGQVEVLITLEFTVAGANDRYELRHRDRRLFYVFARGERDWTASLVDPDAEPAPGPRTVPLAFQIRAGHAPSVGRVQPRPGHATIDPLAAARCASATAWCLLVRDATDVEAAVRALQDYVGQLGTLEADAGFEPQEIYYDFIGPQQTRDGIALSFEIGPDSLLEDNATLLSRLQELLTNAGEASTTIAWDPAGD